MPLFPQLRSLRSPKVKIAGLSGLLFPDFPTVQQLKPRANIWLFDRPRPSKNTLYLVIVAVKLHLSKDIFLYRP
ncbi:hypothetical protein [Microcoleus sp. herbarium14]|uniref:hypothetical protein n=1 Tax=Microcoleus sp. herbarium14 TaxID=3055439 RepID=UPI002FCF162A